LIGGPHRAFDITHVNDSSNKVEKPANVQAVPNF
jgi:hypothetical protein